MTTLELLRLLIIIEGGALMAAFVAILAHAILVDRGDRVFRQRLIAGRGLLLASLEGRADHDTDAGLARLGRRTQIRLLAELAPSLEGAQRATLRELATRLGLAAQAERDCRSRLWWRRLYATRVLTLIDAGIDTMPGLVHDPHQLVRTQVAEWAALHPTTPIMRSLVTLLDDPKRIARFAVQDTLLRIGGPAVAVLMSSLGPMTGAGIASGLHVAARMGDAELLPLGLSFVEHPVAAVRASAADVLGATGGADAIAALTRLVGDPAPEVRLAAVRGLGRLRHWESAATFLALLGDPTWPVRRETAVALTAMGAPGSLILRTAVRGSDRFAADIAAQALGAQESAA